MIKIPSSEFNWVCGVYKITFGELYYIGCSTNIGNRIRSHTSLINRLLAGKTPLYYGSYLRLLPYLMKNSDVRITVDVLCVCSEPELINKEIFYTYSKDTKNEHKNCVNLSEVSWQYYSVNKNLYINSMNNKNLPDDSDK